MSEGFPRLQVSFFVKDDQYVVRGDSPEEVAEDAARFAVAADKIADGIAEAKKVLLVKHVFTSNKHDVSNVTQQSPVTTNQRPTASTAPPARSAPVNTEEDTCTHGRVERSGTSRATGKPYAGSFCTATNRSEQCKPTFYN